MVRKESMRAAGQRGGLIAAVLAVGLGGAACGGAGGSSRAATSFGHMAGYVWTGPVTSVAASWTVPRMSGPG
ncbi:MAG: hypothetical protein ACXVUX_22070, partial [Solirubrobacteraceae bacterium]